MHYTCNEDCGKVIITIINKKKTDCKIRVMSIDGTAEAGKDYE